jgi:cytochrome P450
MRDLVEPFESEPLMKAWLGPFLCVLCLNPEDARIILNSPDCQDKPRIFYSSLAEFGLLTINGEEYKAHRKATTPLFTPKSLRSFLPLFDKVANEFLVNFDKNLDEKAFDISCNTMDFALNSTLITFLGVERVDEAVRLNFLKHLAA